AVVINICIVYNRCMTIEVTVSATWCVIAINSWTKEIALWNEYPEVQGDVYMYTHTHARPKRRPAVLASTLTPRNPSWYPFVSRNPHPTIMVAVVPATVVERCPSPVIVRIPCVTIFRVYPVSVGGI